MNMPILASPIEIAWKNGPQAGERGRQEQIKPKMGAEEKATTKISDQERERIGKD